MQTLFFLFITLYFRVRNIYRKRKLNQKKKKKVKKSKGNIHSQMSII